MNQDIKKRWVEALRSGKYSKTRGSLRDNKGFCCLGVLCDLAEQDGLGKWQKQGTEYFAFENDDERVNSLLSQKVVNWAKLDSVGPMVKNKALSTLNDVGVSFREIADLIEEQL